MRKGLLVEDDLDGLNRAKRCAPNPETLEAYNATDIDWTWVKNYDQFCKHLLKHGIPDIIAFDHDLGDDAYKLWHKHGGYVSEDINYDEYETKTGYHCAQFLVNLCLDSNIKLKAQIYSHSMNEKGRQNILSLLSNLKKHQANET
jgi:hypothetical protein